MQFRSLVPTGGHAGLARPAVMLFGPLQREIDRLFDDFARGVGAVGLPQEIATIVPNVDITETDSEIVITAELPGLERKDVEITLEDDALTIRGEKRIEEGNDGSGRQSAQRSPQGGQGGQDGDGGQGPQGTQAAQTSSRDTKNSNKSAASSQQSGQASQGKSGTQGNAQTAGTQGSQGGRNVHLRECSYGVFLRVLQLPPGIDTSKIEATMSNGVLRIRIPKSASSHGEPRRIEVKEAA